jgi:hypothetical protein
MVIPTIILALANLYFGVASEGIARIAQTAASALQEVPR